MICHKDGQNPPHSIKTEPLGGLIADNVGNAARHFVRRGRGGQIPTLFGRAIAYGRAHGRCRRTRRLWKGHPRAAVYLNERSTTPAVSRAGFLAVGRN